MSEIIPKKWIVQSEIRRSELLLEMKAMHNDICIVGLTKLGRLIGFGEDESDFYYIILEMSWPFDEKEDRQKIVWYSAVGHCQSLKGKIETYDAMEQVFCYNNAGPTENFLIKYYD